MVLVPTVRDHFDDHLHTDTGHQLPYERRAAADTGCHRVRTSYVPDVGLSDLNTLSLLITARETTHVTVEEMEI